MSSIAILGSGFGLYGYLPALVACGKHVVLPKRYRDRYEARTELKPFSNCVQWAEDECDALKNASGVVLALSPDVQCHWLTRCLDQPQLNYLFLEKPLAPNPHFAAKQFESLRQSGKTVRMAYVFRFQNWADSLRSSIEANPKSSFELTWRFQAQHFRCDLPTWKREHEQGGGPLRFYGIHLIALLAEIGYTEVLHSVTEKVATDAFSRWRATFAGHDLPVFSVVVDSASSDSDFSIRYKSDTKTVTVIQQPSPFLISPSTNQVGSIDGRVDTLISYCRSAWESKLRIPEFYSQTIQLWNELERFQLRSHSIRSAA